MAIKSGTVNIDAAGTAQAFSATREVFCSLTVQAHPDNAGDVYVGGPAVSSATGIVLGPGDSFPLLSSEGDSINIQFLYGDAANTGDDINFIGVAR